MSNKVGVTRGTAYIGTNANQPPNWHFEMREPNQYDTNNVSIGDLWLDQSAEPLPEIWSLVSLAGTTQSKGALAHWVRVTGQGGGTVDTLTGNTGGPVPADGDGNINVIGDGITTSVVGTPGTNTLTISVIGSGSGASNFPTDAGTAVQAGGVLQISSYLVNNDCGSTVFFDGASNEVSLNTSDLDFNTCVGQFSGNINATSVGFNTALGYASLQSIDTTIGSTAIGYQALASVDSGSYNIGIGYQAGVNYTAEGSNIVIGNMGTVSDLNTIRIGTQGTGDSEQDTCFIAGIRGTTVASPQFVTVDPNGQLGSSAASPGGGGLAWSVIVASPITNPGNGYFTNGGSPVTVTLPATSAVGDQLALSAMNANGWVLAQLAGQSVQMTNQATTTGAGGSLASTDIGDSIYLVCNVANLSWIVQSSMGNITIV
jgi:hypothetical protein